MRITLGTKPSVELGFFTLWRLYGFKETNLIGFPKSYRELMYIKNLKIKREVKNLMKLSRKQNLLRRS